jgi:hypothetical protein
MCQALSPCSDLAGLPKASDVQVAQSQHRHACNTVIYIVLSRCIPTFYTCCLLHTLQDLHKAKSAGNMLLVAGGSGSVSTGSGGSGGSSGGGSGAAGLSGLAAPAGLKGLRDSSSSSMVSDDVLAG